LHLHHYFAVKFLHKRCKVSYLGILVLRLSAFVRLDTSWNWPPQFIFPKIVTVHRCINLSSSGHHNNLYISPLLLQPDKKVTSYQFDGISMGIVTFMVTNIYCHHRVIGRLNANENDVFYKSHCKMGSIQFKRQIAKAEFQWRFLKFSSFNRKFTLTTLLCGVFYLIFPTADGVSLLTKHIRIASRMFSFKLDGTKQRDPFAK